MRARSVHDHVASAVLVLAVCGRVSRLLVGLFGVRCLSSQRVFAQSDLLCAGVPFVAMLVGARCMGPARYVCTVRRPPAAGERSRDKWSDRCRKFFSPADALFPAPPWQGGMHNPLSSISWCSVAVLPVSLVPLIFTPAVGGKAPPVPLGVSLCSPWEPQGVVPAWWCCARAPACLSAVRLLVSCVAGHSGGVSVSRCRVWWLGWLGWFGLCCGVGTLRPTWRAGLGVTHPGPVGRGVGAAPCGELVAPRMPRVGLWRTGVPGSVAAPLPLIDAVNCLRGVCPSYHSHRLYVS